MSEPLHKCMTKATTAEGDQVRYSPNWIVARRAILKIFDDRIECGDWTIPLSKISDAVLVTFRGNFFLEAHLLRIDTAEKTYHFGLNAGEFWKGELPFEVKRERRKLAYSWFRIIFRIILLCTLGYLLWEWLAK